ncbi:MAG: hypothetical protein QOH86_2017 [Sphingomonadales bacterium]|nr:hypothetical protein [Sphingomonadales bacterium]
MTMAWLRRFILVSALSPVSTAFASPPSDYFPPPGPTRPPMAPPVASPGFPIGWGPGAYNRTDLRWSEAGPSEASAAAGGSARFAQDHPAHLSAVTFEAADGLCLDVLPGEATRGGRVRLRPCSGLEGQVFLADYQSASGTPIVAWGGRADGEQSSLCLERGDGDSLIVAPCRSLFVEVGVGPVADPQRWVWLPDERSGRIAMVAAPTTGRLAALGPLCIAPERGMSAIPAAGLVPCGASAGSGHAPLWTARQRR